MRGETNFGRPPILLLLLAKPITKTWRKFYLRRKFPLNSERGKEAGIGRNDANGDASPSEYK